MGGLSSLKPHERLEIFSMLKGGWKILENGFGA